MRPIRVEIQAFGPYASSAEVDFERLGGHRLFLVHGATGAGKSTILDAICFALYGETSGAERDGRQMRCAAAAPERETVITLDFAIGTRRFRIQRSPDQEIPKQRGEGMRRVQHSATLWERTHCRSDEQDGDVLETKVRQVDSKVIELIGFDAAEFRQVVLLPQGRFRELLSADTNERQRILQTLFQTGIFKRIEEALREQAGKTIEETNQLRMSEKATLDAASAPNSEALAERLSKQRMRLAELETAEKRLAAIDEAARGALEGSKRIEKLHDDLASARGNVAALARREADIVADRRELERARAARSVQPSEAARNAHRKAAESSAKELRQLQAVLDQQKKESTQAEEELEREKEREPMREAARTKVSNLAAMTKKVNDIAGFVDSRDKLIETRKLAARKQVACKDSISSLKRRIPELEKEVDRLNYLAAQVKPRDAVRDALAQRLQKRLELKDREADFRTAKSGEAEARSQHVDTERKLEEADHRLQSLRTELLRHHAGLLARELAPGQPCPVCGAKDHPRPATLGAKSDAAGRMRELDARIADLKEQEKTQRAELATAVKKVATASAKLESVQEALGDAHSLPLARFQAEVREAKHSWAEAKAASEALPEARTSLEGARKALREEEKNLQRFTEDMQKIENDVSSVGGRLAEAQAGVPEELRTVTKLEAAQRRSRDELDALVDAANAAQKKFEVTQKGLAGALAAHKNEHANWDRSVKAQRDADAALAAALKKYGYASEKAYTEAKRTGAEMQDLDERIVAYDKNRTVANAELNRIVAELGDKPRPDLEPLNKAVMDASNALARCRGEITETRTGIKNDKKSIDALRAYEKQLQKLDERYRVEGLIADVARGQNERNLSFERYVLGTFLQEGLIAANQRLGIMSEGRYELHLMSEITHGARAAGLDLSVLDSYTGQKRSVKTLSGGEGFLAALALALGLSDVVQGYAGGIRMEALFIDEGFDSLDPEALDRAIQALIKLQAGGRLVGVISHVEELRERIPARIEIASSRSGSTILMHV